MVSYFCLSEIASERIIDELIAAWFHPDSMLRETAAWCIHRLDPAAYAAHLTYRLVSLKIGTAVCMSVSGK